MSEQRPHTGAALMGAVLGSYRICAEITSGGMGTVFRGEHVLLGRPAAVKLLRPDLTSDPGLVQRFVNEARAVTACKHPGIIEVYDFGYSPDGRAFIVMELLEGESLGRRLARTRLSEPEAVGFAYGVASALRAAHAAGIVHRDLKPDNIFLVPDPDGGLERTKVLDFGIAKLADAAPATRHTQTGALIGTPLYMAPEQARAAGLIDHRADLYSLGCILYHMLVGRPPFVADGAGEVIALQLFAEPEPPSRLVPVSPIVEQIVLRLLAKEPAERFESAAELVAALAALDLQLTTRPTWPSGQVVMGDAQPTVPNGRLPVAVIDGAKPLVQPHLDAPTEPNAMARKRPMLAKVAGAISVAAIAGGLAFALIRGDGVPAGTGAASGQADKPVSFSQSPAAGSNDKSAASSPSSTTASTGKPAASSQSFAAISDNKSAGSIQPPVGSADKSIASAQSPAAASADKSLSSSQSLAGSADKPVSSPQAPAATSHNQHPRSSAKHPGKPAAPHKPAANDSPGGDKVIEVIRDAPASEPSRPGDHTLNGSPMETSVDIGKHRPKDAAPP